MLKVTFIEPSGNERIVEFEAGDTLMETARDNDVEGIDADCGGACACATCHVYVDAAWAAKLPSAQEMENDMLDFTEAPKTDFSRLSCQIEMTETLNGLVVQVPKIP